MFNASHLDTQHSFTGQPGSSSCGGRGVRPDPEFLNKGERLDVLLAPFQSFLKIYFFFMGENHIKQNNNHSRVFLHILKHDWRGTLINWLSFVPFSRVAPQVNFM